MLTINHQTITFHPTRARAEALAAELQLEAFENEVWRVHQHDRGWFVALYDASGFVASL